MIKVEAKENNTLLDNKSHFAGHFIWSKSKIHNGAIAIKTFMLWKTFYQDIQSKSGHKYREMNRNQIQWETTQH